MAGKINKSAHLGGPLCDKTEIVSLVDVASFFNCTTRQVSTYIKQGLLPALRRPSGRVVGVPQWALDEFASGITK